MSTHGYYYLLEGGAVIVLFCVGIIARSIQVVWGKSWAEKLVMGTMCFISVLLIGGLGFFSVVTALREVEHQEPHISTPAIPQHWWK